MKILPVLSLFSALVLAGADVPPGLLFHADFDAYNVSASFAKGSPKSTNFKNPDLQLRMFPGIREKGNALRLENEFCAWRMKGNFTPARGTVSVWVSPQTWKFSEKKFQVFFEARQKDFRLLLYKYRDTPYVTAYLQVGKRSFTASAKTDDASWKAGSWHHVAAVWNADELRLYTDGTLPARYAPPGKVPAVSLVKFSPALHLPEAASDGFIALGNLFRGFRVDPKDATALDELKIYDRCLSASEIQAEYEKYFPSALAVKPETPPVATIPRTTRAPLVDGVIDEEEWRDATRVPLFKAYKTENHLARSETWLRMKSDAENLYLGFSTDLPNTKCNVTENDGNVYSDDSFEFFIEDAAKQELWFCVNGNGALFDAKNGNRAWNSHALAGAHRSGSKGWSAEIAIPLSALGSPKAGERRHANFWTLNFAKLPSCYWSWYGTPEAKMGDGIVISSGTDEYTGIERLGPVFNGRLDLLVTGRGASPVSARYETAEKTVNFEGNALNRAWKAELPTGRQRLYIERKDKAGNVSFRYEFSYFVNFPVALSFQAYPLRKRIDVKSM